MIKLFKPYISKLSKQYVFRVLSGTQIAQGPEVDLFEKEFAAEFGFEPWQIVSLNSGTSALELAYEIAGVDNLTNVLTPVLTCTATNIPLLRRGSNIVFVDVEGKNNLNVCPKDFRLKLERNAASVGVFVHFGGSSEGLTEIESICDEFGIDLICDAAQALGSHLSRKARFSAISLQAIKSLTAGDGGVLICRDEADAELARKLRWFGYDRGLKQMLGDTDLEVAGYKMHMNDIAAAIARGNLHEWGKIRRHRKEINDIYTSIINLNPVPIKMKVSPGIWNPCIILCDGDWQSYIGVSTLYEFEIGQYHYRNDKYSIFKKFKNKCPNMDSIEDKYFLLPCHMDVSLTDAARIASVLMNKTSQY